MKIFALLMSIFVLVSAAVALKHPICGLEHSVDGDGEDTCRARIESWSYKYKTNECVSFIYGGCGGNDNRFDILAKCKAKCKELINVTYSK